MQLHRRFSNFQFPIRPTVLWLLLSLNLTLTARAQEAPPILSLEQAIALALKQHATLIAAAQDTRAAQAGLRQARSALFPQLTLQSSYSRFESARSGFTIGNPGATENRETSLNVSQLIWDSGLTQASIRRAVAAARASRWGEEEARQNVAAQVARAYYGALRAQALVRLNKAVVQRAEKEVELAQTAFEIGTGARLDILRAQVQVSNTQVDLIAARNQVETALAELKNTMGVPRTQTFQVVETAPLPDMDQPLEDLIARAWKQRPETHRFAATRETQAQSLRTARIQCQPQLSIHANYEDFL